MPIEELMWVEKYRPHRLEDVINQTEVKERLGPLLEKQQEMPHLLFAGPPGSGKTTVAQIVAEKILGDLKSDYTLSLNASDERGIRHGQGEGEGLRELLGPEGGRPLQARDTGRSRRNDA